MQNWANTKTGVESIWNSFGIHPESLGNSMELAWNWRANPMNYVGIWRGIHAELLGNAWGIYGNSYELFGKPSAIHGKLLGNAWGLFLGNSFVRRGPITGRTHPHACKIPYKTALPVLCPHRFILDPFLVTFSLPFLEFFFQGFLMFLRVRESRTGGSRSPALEPVRT